MYYTLKDLAQLAELNERTVLRYLHATGTLHAGTSKDGRRWRFTEGDLDAVRAEKQRHEQERTRTLHAVYMQDTDAADLAARLASLEAAFAALRERAPYLFTERTVSAAVTRSEGAEYPGMLTDDVMRVPRQIRTTARPTVATRPLTHDGLPEGLVSWRTFAEAHGIPQRTVKHAIDDGKLPLVRGQWQMRSATGGYYLQMALDAAGQRAFYEKWSHRSDFVACAQCPHRMPLVVEETLVEVAGVMAAVEEE